MTPLTPAPLTEAEQAAYVEIYAIAHNSELLLPQMGEGATCGGCQSMARAAVAAVRPPLADETALQLGRDCLRDGLEPFLKRLVGPEHTMRLLSAVRGEILRAAADSWLQTDQAVSMRAGAYVEEWLLNYAKAFESLSLPASKETPK